MPRVRIRKTSRGQVDLSKYTAAYNEVKAGISLRKAAESHGIYHCSLLRYIRKRDASDGEDNQTMGYKAHNRVFNDEHERELSKYLISYADIYFGLSTKEARKLAYELSVKYNLSRPFIWDNNKMAGEEWLRMYMRRNPGLNTHIARAPSLSRATSFTKNNAIAFYDNLSTVMDRHKFEPHNIYSTTETGITTKDRTNRIVAKCDARPIDSVTSAERGTLVTISFTANAIGNVIPPFFVFPRVCYQEHLIRDRPAGSAVSANSSGWTQDETFMHFLGHFKEHTNVSSSHKVLLLIDNHSSYIHIDALDFCNNNGIILLSFPPHCSHKLHPLDRSVYGPLKEALNSSCDAWIQNHVGRAMSIFDIPEIVASAAPLALTSTNIQAGFSMTGIYPYNRHMFTELELASASDISNVPEKMRNIEAVFLPNKSDPPENISPPQSSSL